MKVLLNVLIMFLAFGGALFMLGCAVAFAGWFMEQLEKEKTK